MTPSELIAGISWGFDTFKLFPAQQAGGVSMLKALSGPFPDVVFCPTGGITRATAPEFLALRNVLCVGGSWVAPTDAVRAGDWREIEELARDAASLRKRSESKDSAKKQKTAKEEANKEARVGPVLQPSLFIGGLSYV